MPIQPISFGVSSRPGRFGPDGGARLVNAFVEPADSEAKAPWPIYCRPGLKSFATTTGTGFRGGIEFGSAGYVVSGTAVDKVAASGAVMNIGTMSGSAPVFMARNRKQPDAQIALVSEGQAKIISADILSPITDPDLPPPVAVDTIGGYFVFPIADGRYFWTAIDEGTSIDALDFASAEANPDGLIGVIARTQEIVLLGQKSIEFHALTGSSRVFERVSQTTLQLGCLSAGAAKTINGVPIFPATDGTVRQLSGYTPERISTHDVERSIDALSDKSVLTAYAFSLVGHQFYVLNAPSFTWACDLLTRNWYQWSSYGSQRFQAEGYLDIGGKRIVGDASQAKLYELSLDANDDAGTDIVWELTTGPVGAYPGRIIADELYVDVLPGAGLNSTESEKKNPQVMLSVSDDDGKSWSDEMTASVGKIGEYSREVSFLNLGASGEDGFRFRLSMSAPVARCLTRAALRYTPLAP